ncbi:MAG: class A beta-lactamase [Rhodospirillales bacterium 69-11]|nr:class A beta-lactamase [Rhodospirillales bacterium]OJW25450.1 MAG: class A beta-lactamase [Rhodospirillales bacterium 69-11]
MIGRRMVTSAGLALLVTRSGPARAEETFAMLEAQSGGRLGVAALDTGSGRQFGTRATERFPLCSTFKLLLAGSVLARVDAGQEKLDRIVQFTRAQLVPYSPATGPAADGPGMRVGALCEAAVTLSDNTAANLLLGSMGGPAGLTRFIRSLGDEVTRLDRTEPTLNEAVPGDPRDTTTPADMVRDMQRLVLGDALSRASRGQLVTWLRANKTGDKRLRAGVPPGWQVGDKTGTGERGTANDAGILWPPGGRAPILVAAYLTGATERTPAERDATLAGVGRIVAATVAG